MSNGAPGEHYKRYGRNHYQSHRQAYLDKAVRQKDVLVEIVRVAKSVPCVDCEKTYPSYVMDFDHRPGVEKVMNVAHLVNQGNRSKLLQEMAKCDVVCANCHRERTHQRLVSKV